MKTSAQSAAMQTGSKLTIERRFHNVAERPWLNL